MAANRQAEQRFKELMATSFGRDAALQHAAVAGLGEWASEDIDVQVWRRAAGADS